MSRRDWPEDRERAKMLEFLKQQMDLTQGQADQIMAELDRMDIFSLANESGATTEEMVGAVFDRLLDNDFSLPNLMNAVRGE